MNPSALNSVRQAAEMLRNGGLVGLPTETVYGLAADARNPDAVARIFVAKQRPVDHPLIVHLGDAAQLQAWARDIPADAWLLAEAFWPGPMTLILKRAPHVLDAVTGGLDTVALRIPDHPLALAVLADFGSGLRRTFGQSLRAGQSDQRRACAGRIGRCGGSDPGWRTLPGRDRIDHY